MTESMWIHAMWTVSLLLMVAVPSTIAAMVTDAGSELIRTWLNNRHARDMVRLAHEKSCPRFTDKPRA